MEDKIRCAFAQIHADAALVDSTLTYLRSETAAKKKKRKSFVSSAGVWAVAAMVFLVVGIFSHNLYFTAAAHISIDVNPSVELTLNRFDRVIGAYAFNEDGAGILGKVSLRGKTYSEAAELLLSAVEAGGYIAGDSLISVTVQAASSETEQALCKASLLLISERILPVQASAEIEVFPVSSEVWGNAHGSHMSPSKYLAIQQLMEVDDNVTIEDYADRSIRQIRQRTHECQSGHMGSNDQSPEASRQNGHGCGHAHMPVPALKRLEALLPGDQPDLNNILCHIYFLPHQIGKQNAYLIDNAFVFPNNRCLIQPVSDPLPS